MRLLSNEFMVVLVVDDGAEANLMQLQVGSGRWFQPKPILYRHAVLHRIKVASTSTFFPIRSISAGQLCLNKIMGNQRPRWGRSGAVVIEPRTRRPLFDSFILWRMSRVT